jgi:glucokinase
MSNVLLLDIGGTNIRYAYANKNSSEIFDANKENLDTLKGFDNLLNNLLKNGSIKSMVVSVAGPMINGSISMTNRDFKINAEDIKKEHNLDNCFLLNDWESIGYSLSSTKSEDISFIKKGRSFNKNSLFIGPGTGLGGALVIDNDFVLPTEIGNTTMLTERFLKNFLIKEDNSYLTLEDVLSGTAISSIYKTISGKDISAEEVVKLFEAHDPIAIQVIDGFTISLAEAISDLALIFISGNGIYLAGGLIRSLSKIIDTDLFIRSFLSNKKSIHKSMLNDMPIGVVNRQHTCLHGNLNFYNIRNNKLS